MIFSLSFVPDHAVYGLFSVLQSFVRAAAVTGNYRRGLFSESFRTVLDQSPVLDGHFRKLFRAVQRLPQVDREKIAQAFEANNAIETLCDNPAAALVQLSSLPNEAGARLAELCRFLWDDTLDTLAFVRACGSSIGDHYQKFRGMNGQVCPFCGLALYRPSGGGRSGYDHYLHKGVYPLSAVNFRNLVPTCTDCNSSPAKGQKELLFTRGPQPRRRRVYFPYRRCGGVVVDVKCLKPPDAADLRGSWDVSVRARDPSEQDLVDAWREIYDIDRRFGDFVADTHPTWIDLFIVDEKLERCKIDAQEVKRLIRDWAVRQRSVIHLRPGGLLLHGYFEYILREASEDYFRGLCMRIERVPVSQPAVG